MRWIELAEPTPAINLYTQNQNPAFKSHPAASDRGLLTIISGCCCYWRSVGYHLEMALSLYLGNSMPAGVDIANSTAMCQLGKP